ncbi:MAG TPA: hypothetical protein ENN60_00270 [archaeon]|nr:hypothetical protein [archaeon]
MTSLIPKHTRRGAAELVGSILMVLVIVALIAEAFLIGMPILNKRMDQASVSYIERALGELSDAIEITARQGGETQVNLETKSRFTSPPSIKLEQDAGGEYKIVLRGQSHALHYASVGIPLNDFIGPYNTTGLYVQSTSVEKVVGTLGVNKGVVVTASSTKISGGIRLIMEVVPRPIRDPSQNVITRIRFQPISGKSTSATLPTRIIVKAVGQTTDIVNEGTSSSPVMVTYRTITVGVGFE